MQNEKKITQREQVKELLKKGWYSGFAMNMAIKSTGGAPRIIELKTTKPTPGWKIIERRSPTDKCQEYRLVRDAETEINIPPQPAMVDGQPRLFAMNPEWNGKVL